MTREEQRAKAAHEYIHSDSVAAGNEVLAFDDFINGAKWADQHPHWIPVEERKPQERGHYLVYSQFGDVWLSEWMQDKEGRWDWYVAPICVGIISKVTHWMPLPEEPRKEENDE